MRTILKMLGLSNTTNLPSTEEEELCGEADEPPDPAASNPSLQPLGPSSLYPKSATAGPDLKKESLLTRALLDRPDPSSSDSNSIYLRSRGCVNLPTSSTHSSASTAELTSDGGLTSPEQSNTPSPPLPSQFTCQRPTAMDGTVPPKVSFLPIDIPESNVEANLGRKRCIKFACNRKDDNANEKKQEGNKAAEPQAAKTEEPPKRKSMLTFACPARRPETSGSNPGYTSDHKVALQSNSPAPQVTRSLTDSSTTPKKAPEQLPKEPIAKEVKKTSAFPGLGEFQYSEATRFHEFASSEGEDDEWVNKEPLYQGKITFQDCMKKENAIRRLGEEAEEEARQDEEDEEDGDDDEDEDEDDETIHDLSSDDGNESDNEAGFADSDSEDGSEYEFWASSTVTATAATSTEHVDIVHPGIGRKVSDSSVDSLSLGEGRRNMSQGSIKERKRKSSKAQKSRPGTPDLPDSTDFVCGTLDEDRPLEAAFISCMEQRRRSKHVLIPQDIDPSFPTTDPEDNDDDLDEDDDNEDDDNEDSKEKQVIGQQFEAFKDGTFRGREAPRSRKTSPQHSPKRLQSPPPRRARGHSPKRLRSPPPLSKLKTSQGNRRLSFGAMGPVRQGGINITGLTQRSNRPRTKSLPRTPNPFFIRLEKAWQSPKPDDNPDCDASRSRETHARGAIDIVKGLEQRRQKRKEKFWRQHCRKTAKEGQERKPLPGKGAERMKELGLEAAERCRAYGVEQAQLMLSV